MTTPAEIEAKILSAAELIERFGRPRSARVVFTNGCFDIIHRGHVEYLARARRMGDALVVGLNSDRSVSRLKGEARPMHPQADRAVVLAALASVDAVTIFDDDTPIDLIRALLPDVLAKGGDYTPESIVGADDVRRAGGEVEILPLVPGRSTTGTIERLMKGS